MSRSVSVRCAVAAVCFGLCVPAQADFIDFTADTANSSEGLGDFSGRFTYDYDVFADLGRLSLELTNTSALAGGAITGLVFNIASSDSDLTFTLIDAPNSTWEPTRHSDPTYGSFDFGAALRGKFLGGNPVSDGIQQNQTAAFEWTVSADDADALVAGDFLTPNDMGHIFLARFKGFPEPGTAGSDKVPGKIVPPVVVPVPAPVLLAAAGLIGVAVLRRRLV